MITIYRIENEDTEAGMWYRSDASYDPFIKTLTDGKSADLPMGYHERYSQEGRAWYSGTVNREQMQTWFSTQDAIELHDNGYKLFEFVSTQYIEEEYQVIFTREGILSKKEIQLSVLWDMTEDAMTA